MKTFNEAIREQIQDIKNMLDKVEHKPRSYKQQEAAFKTLQQIQEKLYKLTKM